jgi:hypothetical protein
METVWAYVRRFRHGLQDNQSNIARRAGVEKWKYGAGPIFRRLKQHRLISETHDGNAWTWFAQGVFRAIDWGAYLAQKPKALKELNDLRAMWRLPADHLRGVLVDYLDAAPMDWAPVKKGPLAHTNEPRKRADGNSAESPDGGAGA